MNTKKFAASLNPILTLAVWLALGGAIAGCSSDKLGLFGSHSDSEIASDVQSKINSDPNVTNKQVTITADKGVVTLSGTASSELERAAVGNDAGQVAGVKTVVNNLQVNNAATPGMNDMSQQNAMAGSEPEPEPAPAPRRARRPRSSTTSQRASSYNSNSTATNLGSSSSSSGSSYGSEAPAAPVRPATVTIAEGTPVSVRLIDSLSSETSKAGESFRASLENPIVGDDDRVAIPANSDVEGTVVEVKPSTHFTGHSELILQLTKVTVGARSYNISTNQWQKQGAGRGKRTAGTIGAGAGIGALIGGILGGGKGAAIGAGAGGAAGTGVQGVTKGEAVKLASETRLDFRLQSPLTVTPASTAKRTQIQP